ncbi:hypothetical protein ACIP9H_33460 [Streptomyces sp. NPDC088732]|uniref:hypothetical protein n=1 Tax=Streptomyces sp. NPDC088732 TaxID=3365879 RepID=UPI00381BD6BE
MLAAEQEFDGCFTIVNGRRQPVDRWADLLFQSAYWQDDQRTIWHLDELDPVYCSRIYGFIVRQEDEVGTQLAWDATRGPDPSGDVAWDAATRSVDALLELVSERGWISRTELMQALSRRMRGRPAVEGECFCGYPVAEGWVHSSCYAGMEMA